MPPIDPARRILGAVLAGGRSSRFGSDKALALLDGKPLIDHAIAAITPHVQEVVICGRERPGFACIVDRPAAGQGPLGGINAVLHHARDHGFHAVLTIGCDMPCFPPAAASALLIQRAAVLDGHHLIGLWPVDLAPLLDRHLTDTPDRSLRSWIGKADVAAVHLPDLHIPNINRAEDLAAFLHDRDFSV